MTLRGKDTTERDVLVEESGSTIRLKQAGFNPSIRRRNTPSPNDLVESGGPEGQKKVSALESGTAGDVTVVVMLAVVVAVPATRIDLVHDRAHHVRAGGLQQTPGFHQPLEIV